MKLADNKDAERDISMDIACTVASNFDKLPENVRNELLLKVADSPPSVYSNTGPVSHVASAVSHNFDKLPENLRNELQKKLARHGYNLD